MANPQSLVGRTLSHYRVLEEIGAGGMGVVYRAHDERLDRDLALKVLPSGTLADDAARRQFRTEALALAKLNHPNIATIHDFDSQDDLDFLAMELIPGHPLNKKLIDGPLSEREIQRLGVQFAAGLAAAHGQGVIHRDLKPANLFVTPDGRLKILDFGLAKLRHLDLSPDITQSLETTAAAISGTVPYMSPEQLRGRQVDARTDVYAAGAVLYEMATGTRPFPQRQNAELMAAILHENPPSTRSINRQVSPQLDSVIAKALEKEPERRYQSARELQVALEGLQEGTAGNVGAIQYRAPIYAVGGTLAAVLIVALAVMIWKVAHREGAVGPTTSTVGAVAPGAIRKPAIPARRSVAVLGFRNVSGRADEAWVATALSEMLTTELAAGEKLRTVSGENVARMKADLSLPETDSYAADTLGKMRQTVGADYIVLGSYVPMGKPGERKLRIDLRLEDASAGQVAAAVSQNGSLENLDDLVSKVGADLRKKLGVEEISASDTKMAKATMPSDAEAARLYSEGLNKLRSYDLAGARDLLKRATFADPNFAAAHSALASAWSSMGYDEEARKEAKRAFELSSGASRETRLLIEGLYRRTNNERAKTIEIYRTLYNFFPDNFDYGLSLAQALRLGAKSKEGLQVLEDLKKLPEPFGSSPKIDLEEAQAAGATGDFQRELAAGLRAEQKARALGERILAARALGTQAYASQKTGQHKRALAAAKDEQALYEAVGDKQGKAYALLDSAEPLRSTGDPEAALKAQQEALQISREVGNQREVGVALNNLANSTIALGDLKGAVRLWQEELRICREIDDKDGVAASDVNIGGALFLSGDLRGARKHFEQAMTEYQSNGDKHGVLDARQNLAETLSLLGHLDEAEKNAQQSLTVARAAGDKSTEATILEGLGRISEKRGDLTEAHRRYSESLALRNAISEKGAAAESSLDLANLAIEEGDPQKAQALLASVQEEFVKEKLADDELFADVTAAKALLAIGKPGEAAAMLDAAKSVVPRGQDRAVRFAFEIARGRALGLSGTYNEGISILHQVLRDSQESGFAAQVFEARLALGELDLASGKTGQARTEFLAVKADATAKGYLLVARKAAAALLHAGS